MLLTSTHSGRIRRGDRDAEEEIVAFLIDRVPGVPPLAATRVVPGSRGGLALFPPSRPAATRASSARRMRASRPVPAERPGATLGEVETRGAIRRVRVKREVRPFSRWVEQDDHVWFAAAADLKVDDDEDRVWLRIAPAPHPTPTALRRIVHRRHSHNG